MKQQPIVGAQTPGPRNGRCPLCPSGRKYKQCCGGSPSQEQFDREALEAKASKAFLEALDAPSTPVT